MIDRINATRGGHIITIEDPIEYLHSHKQSLVSQREVPNDAGTFQRALRAALREAPDVIMLGEMRDHETMQTAITAAETGHLLLSSLHTVGAAKTVDRIVDTFPPGQQQQVRIQLSMVLRAVVSQRLVPVRGGGQEPVFEVMTVTPAVQNMIRDGKTHQIDNVIYGGSADRSMLSMDGELERLLRAGKIDRETALRYATNPDALGRQNINSGPERSRREGNHGRYHSHSDDEHLHHLYQRNPGGPYGQQIAQGRGADAVFDFEPRAAGAQPAPAGRPVVGREERQSRKRAQNAGQPPARAAQSAFARAGPGDRGGSQRVPLAAIAGHVGGRLRN